LGELLLRAGVITEVQLRAALGEQKKWGGKLGTLLVEMGLLTEDLLVKALAKQLGFPRIELANLSIPPEALARVDADFAQQHQVLPISLDPVRKQLLVAMADPEKLSVIDEIAFKTGLKVQVALAGPKSLATIIRKVYLSEDLSEHPEPDEDPDAPMKLLNPLGNTQVRRLKEIQAPGTKPAPEAKAPPGAVDRSMEFGDRIHRLEALQKKEVRILKVLVEMLIEKGVITREEYRQKVES
jgi:hypothetical protein